MMGLLEDALRDTFAAQVDNPPVTDNPAGQAIRRAGQLRRSAVSGTRSDRNQLRFDFDL